jgi:hypothetical protein
VVLLAAPSVLAVAPPDAEEPPVALFDAAVESLVLEAPPLPDAAPVAAVFDEAAAELAAPPLVLPTVPVADSFWEPFVPLAVDVSPPVVSVLLPPPSLPLPQLTRPTTSVAIAKALIAMR